MQFTKTFITLAFAVSALAAPTWGSGGSGGGSGGGSSSGAQCCQNVTNSSSLDSVTAGILAALLDVAVSDLNVPIGTGCTPVAILGGVSCNMNTVTCGQVFAPQAIGVNCIPVTVNA